MDCKKEIIGQKKLRTLLESLLEKHHADSFGWALSCCSYDREEAREVLQTVYLKIAEGKICYDGDSGFKTWLFSVIRHTARDYQRKKRNKLKMLASFFRKEQEPAPDECYQEPGRQMELPQTRKQLEKMLNKLPKRQQKILHLVFYQDMTIEQAGEIMGISLGTARTHYQRGKARLREMLQEMREAI